jgi:hypothetical protein
MNAIVQRKKQLSSTKAVGQADSKNNQGASSDSSSSDSSDEAW